MDWILERRRWLAGDEMTIADFAGAAHFSTRARPDYLCIAGRASVFDAAATNVDAANEIVSGRAIMA